MILVVKIMAGLSLSAFTIAALIGFVDPSETGDPFNKLSKRIKDTFKWQFLNKPYILTKIGVAIAFVFGIVSIALS